MAWSSATTPRARILRAGRYHIPIREGKPELKCGFSSSNETCGPIEPCRVMPFSANSNTLNANGLATSAPRFWGNSWFHWQRGSARIPSCARGPCKLEALPTVLRSGPYRFFFYSADRDEPAHVHVEREESEAKFWLDPVRLEWSRGFARMEIRRIEALVGENGALLVRAWHEYFGN